jgi:hypothetical protein
MIATLGQLEMHCIDRLCRQELIDAIRARGDCLPEDLRQGLENQPTDRLRLLLLAARLVHVLRQAPCCRCGGKPPGA